MLRDVAGRQTFVTTLRTETGQRAPVRNGKEWPCPRCQGVLQAMAERHGCLWVSECAWCNTVTLRPIPEIYRPPVVEREPATIYHLPVTGTS